MGAHPGLDIAVVGVGMGATMLVTALATLKTSPRRMWLIDPTPLSGEGFARAGSAHFLNTRARVMGLSTAAPDGFTHFIAEAMGLSLQEAAVTFAPRRHYQAFLEKGLAVAEQALRRQGWTVAFHGATARRLRRDSGLWRIETDDGVIEAGRVVLAVGPARPAPLPGSLSPWGLSQEAAAVERVLIVGAGLTAADAAAELEALGHRGQITMASLDTGFPLPQPVQPPTPVLLSAPTPTASAARLIRALRRTVEAAVGQGQDWRAVMDALRPHTPGLWAALPASTRGRLLASRRFVTWSRLRHRLPPQTAEALDRLLTKGRLTLVQDAVIKTGAGFAVFRSHGRQAFDAIIDGRGFDLRYRDSDIFRDLIQSGGARPCPSGFGLLPDEKRQVGDRLFAMGAILTGAMLETTAAAEIRVQAERIAQALL